MGNEALNEAISGVFIGKFEKIAEQMEMTRFSHEGPKGSEKGICVYRPIHTHWGVGRCDNVQRAMKRNDIMALGLEGS
jgi:hypothetical protein